MEHDVKDETSQTHLGILRLQKRVARLKRLAQKYKGAELTQNALLEISNIATKVDSLDAFYAGVHQHLQQLIPADNLFIATLNVQSNELEIPFFSDEKDSHPSIQFPKHELAELLMSGLTGYVFKTGEPLLCDTQRCDELAAQGQIVNWGSPSHQWLGVPIKHNGQTTGVLVVQSYDETISYGDIELELMIFVCRHISGVMERLRHQEYLAQAIEQRTKELSQAYDKLKQEVFERRRAERLQKSLFEIANIATTNVDSHHFYVQLHSVISHLLAANNCYIALLDETKTHLSFPFYVSQISTKQPNERPLADGLTEYILKHQRPLLLDNTDIKALISAGELYTKAPDLNNTAQMHQWIGIPLFIHGEVRGALTIYSFSATQNYHRKDLELLTFVSQHIATAIERKLATEALKHSYEQLEDKVTERTQELARLNQSLEQEIAQRRRIEQQLIHDAKHDSLTGLPNRAMFMERLNQAVKHVRRHSQDRCAVIFIDLDRFKLINDTLGHLEGDKFLIETARRLGQCIRQNDSLGRLGGDEFVILLDCPHHIEDAVEVAERVLTELSKPYILGQQEFRSGASIGIAISDNQQRDTSESLLRDADAAMYLAKSRGKGCYVVFDDAGQQQQLEAFALEQELKDALNYQQLALQYIPIYDLQRLIPIAFEARLLWQHPRLGKINQLQLCNMAEQCNLQMELDKHALTLLYSEYNRLPNASCQVQIALSSQHLTHKHALRSLKNTLKACPFATNKLLLLFNEQALSKDTENHINGFEQLKKLGVGLGVNHYGTGYSALTSLTFLPISTLKLDPSYASQLDNERHGKLIKAFLLSAQTLELECYCTGINDDEHINKFVHLGFARGQGKQLGTSFTLSSSDQQCCA